MTATPSDPYAAVVRSLPPAPRAVVRAMTDGTMHSGRRWPLRWVRTAERRGLVTVDEHATSTRSRRSWTAQLTPLGERVREMLCAVPMDDVVVTTEAGGRLVAAVDGRHVATARLDDYRRGRAQHYTMCLRGGADVLRGMDDPEEAEIALRSLIADAREAGEIPAAPAPEPEVGVEAGDTTEADPEPQADPAAIAAKLPPLARACLRAAGTQLDTPTRRDLTRSPYYPSAGDIPDGEIDTTDWRLPAVRPLERRGLVTVETWQTEMLGDAGHRGWRATLTALGRAVRTTLGPLSDDVRVRQGDAKPVLRARIDTVRRKGAEPQVGMLTATGPDGRVLATAVRTDSHSGAHWAVYPGERTEGRSLAHRVVGYATVRHILLSVGTDALAAVPEPAAPEPAPEAAPETQESRAARAGSITVRAIEDAWSDIRAQHPEVPDVVAVIAGGTTVTKRTITTKWGHFAPDRWSTDGGRRHELLVSGECLSKGSRHVLETLLHEAAHALNHTRGTQDTSRGGQYHNKRFLVTAVELGLQPPADGTSYGTRGFSDVTLPDATAARYADTLSRLDSARVIWQEMVTPEAASGTAEDGGGEDGEGAAGAKRRSTRTKPKAVCGCGPERAIWASRRVLRSATVMCGECGDAYRMEGEDD